MPYSYDFFNEEVKEFVESLESSDRILDVGAGAGKYGKLLKKEGRKIDCVEVFHPYLKSFALEDTYDIIYLGSVTVFKPVKKQYDLAIFGDVIQTLAVPQAVQVLDDFRKARIPVLVIVPYLYPQPAVLGNPYSEHKQDDLTEEVFHARYPGFVTLFTNEKQGVFLRRPLGVVK